MDEASGSLSVEMYIGNQVNSQNPSHNSRYLLDYDQTSDEEEILGESFNIPLNDGKFVPRNREHKKLAAHVTRELKYFFGFRGNPSAQPGQSSTEHYTALERNVFEEQERLKEEKSKFKKNLKRDTFSAYREIQKLKENCSYKDEKQKIISQMENILRPCYVFRKGSGTTVAGKTYPNFALGTISFVKDRKVFSYENTHVKELNDKHAEWQILDGLFEIVKTNENIKNSDLVIIDLHTALSMCDSCYTHAESLLADMENLRIKIVLVVSYNFPYCTPINPGNGRNLFQKQLELLRQLPAVELDDSLCDQVIPNGGYVNYFDYRKV